MSFDPFSSSTDSLIAPAQNAFAIIPHPSDDLPSFTKAIYVGSGGDVVLRAVGSDADVTFANVPSGTILPVRARALRDSSTATALVGLA